MVGFRRFFMILFLFFASLFIFIFIIRLANSRDGFIGFNDLFSYFENGDIDFYKPISRFRETFDNLSNAVSNLGRSIDITSIFDNNNTSTNFFDIVTSAINGIFKYLGNNVINFFKFLYYILYMPIQLIFNVIMLFVDYIKIFVNFISYIINFEGFPRSNPPYPIV